MAMLASRSELLAWAPVVGADVSTTLLDDCLESASSLIEAYTGRTFTSAAVSVYLDGETAVGRDDSELFLPREYAPVQFQPGITVTENGTALTVARGYSTTAGVIVTGTDLVERARLIRVSSGTRKAWLPGVQNITASFTAGFTSVTMPEDIKSACKWLAWATYKAAQRVGVSSTGKSGASVSLLDEIPDVIKATLDAWRKF